MVRPVELALVILQDLEGLHVPHLTQVYGICRYMQVYADICRYAGISRYMQYTWIALTTIGAYRARRTHVVRDRY
tara:strand:- start:281 stop:505 length:225 start_codon:yes stop_codon:yes gene_type:complete